MEATGSNDLINTAKGVFEDMNGDDKLKYVPKHEWINLRYKMLTNNCSKNISTFTVIFSDCKKNKFNLKRFLVVVSNLALDVISRIAFNEAVVFVQFI